MRRWFVTMVAVAAISLGGVVATSPPASADPPTCTKTDPTTGQCVIIVERPGTQPVRGGGGNDGGGNGSQACVNDLRRPPRPMPCTSISPRWYVPTYWSNDRDCYIGHFSPVPPPSDPIWQGRWPEGAIYFCEPGNLVTTGGMAWYAFWSLTPPAGPAAPPDPAVLARQAIAAMQLKAIRIGIVPEPRPNSIGLIGMPTWMWVNQPTPNTWGPISRSVSAGGITVTADAHVSRIVWNMGDGNSVTCNTAGTPYQDRYGKADSPDCGYHYTRTSAGQPNDAYPVSATSYWTIAWAGGGQTGTINMDFTDNTQIRVGEMQVLITR